MNKGDLINKIAGDAGVSKAQAGRALDSFLGTTMGAVGKGDKVTLVGFWHIFKSSQSCSYWKKSSNWC